MTFRVLAILSLAGGVLFGVAAGLGCGDPSHVYEGRLFLPERHCLGTTSSIDVVEGELPGSCPAICLAQPHADGGRSLYVSTMCGPSYPFMFDTSGTDPLCPSALAAFERNDTCFVDGGSANPLPPIVDAGGD